MLTYIEKSTQPPAPEASIPVTLTQKVVQSMGAGQVSLDALIVTALVKCTRESGEKHMIPNDLGMYDYRENLIVDKDNPILIQKAWRDRFSSTSHWQAGYGGKAYFSRPHSEDALTWNVFRTLELAGNPGLELVSDFFGISRVHRILFWGCDVENHGEEQQLLNILIRTIDGKHRGTMTEPDLVIVAEEEVVFVECKLNQSGTTSPWKAQGKGAEKRLTTYLDRFPELVSVPQWEAVYQLIRQYVYARSLGECLRKEPLVIPLVNGIHKEVLSPYYSRVKNSPINSENTFRDFAMWQGVMETVSSSSLLYKEPLLLKIQRALARPKSD